MIIREEYLKKLFTYMDAPIIKILAGIRRCGKSTILENAPQRINKQRY